jgi:S-layer homology domain
MTFVLSTLLALSTLSPLPTKAENLGLGAAAKVSKLAQEICQDSPAGESLPPNSQCACYSKSKTPPKLQPNTQLQSGQQANLQAAPTFNDLDDHWAKPYIEALAAQGLVQGFEDGTFRPDAELKWSDFAGLLQRSFPTTCANQLDNLGALPVSHWARKVWQHEQDRKTSKVEKANVSPKANLQQSLSRVQVVVALVEEMNLNATPEMIRTGKVSFQDASQIPEYAKEDVAIAVANRLVVPDPKNPYLYGDRPVTRADVAALIYKSLVSSGAMLPVAEDLGVSMDAVPIDQTFEGAEPAGDRNAFPVLPLESMHALFSTPNSPGTLAIGMAEGTRTVDGRPTWAYWGHTDPGNGVRNQGTFSYQHGARNPEEADMKQLQRLSPHIDALKKTAEAYGMELSVMELVAGVDLANQAPLATPHYVGLLKQARDTGLNGMAAILEARAYSFVNPETRQLEAGGFRNDWNRLRHDQARRLAAMYYTLQTHGVVN